MRITLRKEPRHISRCTSEVGNRCFFYGRNCTPYPCIKPPIAYVEAEKCDA